MHPGHVAAASPHWCIRIETVCPCLVLLIPYGVVLPGEDVVLEISEDEERRGWHPLHEFSMHANPDKTSLNLHVGEPGHPDEAVRAFVRSGSPGS